jgi:LmbE family N-acetylglucosaminyl deacetylase
MDIWNHSVHRFAIQLQRNHKNKIKMKYFLSFVILIGIYLYISWLYGWFPFTIPEQNQAQSDIDTLKVAPDFKSTDRILIFSPHPDDESLSCGGTVSKALDAGAQVFICWMCAGDGFQLDAELLKLKHQLPDNDTLSDLMLDLGKLRLQEARNAGDSLGLPANHLFLMGYGDSTIFQMFTYPDSLVTSDYTNVNKGPYPNTISYNEEYRGRNVEKNIHSLIDSLQPTIIYAPSPIDDNIDHAHTGMFVIKAFQSFGKSTMALRNYIVHGGDYNITIGNISEYPIPHGLHTDMALNQPVLPASKSYFWVKTLLSTKNENVKYSGICAHVSQMEIMSGFLQAFVRTNELYAVLDSAQMVLPRQYYFHPDKH